MALILHIDTAVTGASVCLAHGPDVLGTLNSESAKDSASWLHVAIQQLMSSHNKQLTQLEAVAVSAGPGSYTGLRVGMSAAKGLCYTLAIPLITINTLQAMAAAAHPLPNELLCPMIDARRMEVFTALFNSSLHQVVPYAPLIVTESFFADWLMHNPILFFGNGSQKASALVNHPNARFASVTHSASNMAVLATTKFDLLQFSELAYTEPFYGKDFHLPLSKKNY